MGSNAVVNPADPFLVHGDELFELTGEQGTALVEISKAGGRLDPDGLSRKTLGSLLHLQLVAPAGMSRVRVTGIGIRLLARAVEYRQETPWLSPPREAPRQGFTPYSAPSDGGSRVAQATSEVATVGPGHLARRDRRSALLAGPFMDSGTQES